MKVFVEGDIFYLIWHTKEDSTYNIQNVIYFENVTYANSNKLHSIRAQNFRLLIQYSFCDCTDVMNFIGYVKLLRTISRVIKNASETDLPDL